METKARYALIGLFVSGAIAAAFAFVYWLHTTGGLGQRAVYQIRFENSVSGLLIGSNVLFNGVRVGEVFEEFPLFAPGQLPPDGCGEFFPSASISSCTSSATTDAAQATASRKLRYRGSVSSVLAISFE